MKLRNVFIYSAVALLLGVPASNIAGQDSSKTATTDSTVNTAVAEGPLSLRVDLTSNMLYVYQGDKEKSSYVVSPGKDAHPTPRGDFRIRKLVWNPPWVPPDEEWAKNKTPKPAGHPQNPMKVVKIFFKEPDYYIHGTSEVDKLGMPASHGCLRMSPEDAGEVARWLMEHGGEPRNESWFKRIFRFRSQTKVVYLKNPISLTITG